MNVMICEECNEHPVQKQGKDKNGNQKYSKRCRRCNQNRYGYGKGRGAKLPTADRKALIVKQSNKCAICFNTEKLLIDHDHKTNKVRGALCKNCNVGLGMFKDCVKILENAIKYLKNT